MAHGKDIDTLLDLDGVIIEQAGGYWTKFEIRRIPQATEDIRNRRGLITMSIKTIKIGIMSQKEIRERTLAIAQGKYKPKPDEPKIWFTSIRSLAEVLSDENQALLQTITDKKPDSISELAEMTGRQLSNLSRTLKTLSSYGFVKLEKHNKTVCPIAKATTFNVIFGMHWGKNVTSKTT